MSFFGGITGFSGGTGQLPRNLGVTRSSLPYNLNRLLAEKRIKRLGASPAFGIGLRTPEKGVKELGLEAVSLEFHFMGRFGKLLVVSG